jgi:hypothetical protein
MPRGWGRYPGFGPWSHLQRPGWKFGRGWRWRYYSQPAGLTKEEEIRLLEDEARFLEERLNEIRKRLDELRKP